MVCPKILSSARVKIISVMSTRARRFRVRLCYTIATVVVVINVFYAIKWKYHIKDTKPYKSPAFIDFHWKTIFPNVSVFSAYYDDRKVLPRPRVQILGFERQQNSSTPYYCLLVYKNKKFCERKSSTLFILARDHFYVRWEDKNVVSYEPFAFTCPLPSSEIPQRVAISSTKDCRNYGSLSENTIPVVNRKAAEMKTFVVCICSPVFRVLDTGELVAAFEMNRLLGAEFFTVYAHNLPPRVLKILRKYSEDGLAEVVENWAVGMPQHVHYYGQLLSINDCLHKNIYTAKYLVYTDLDEVIMPLHHPSWNALLQDIDKPEQGTFVFENTFLYSTQSRGTVVRQCDGNGYNVLLSTPRYINFRNRSKPVSRSRITKYITKTAVTLVPQVHKVIILASGYGSGLVPMSKALLYHYRVPYKQSRFAPINKRIQDTIMDSYENKLLTAITNRLCEGAATIGG